MTVTTSAVPPPPRAERWWTSPLIWVTLAVGLGGTAAVWQLTVARERAVRSVAFTEHATAVSAALHGRLWGFEQLLRGASGLFYASSEVTADEWRAFTRRVDVLNATQGLATLGFIERRQGVAGGPDRYTVRYLEGTHGGTSIALGQELSEHLMVREALDRARRRNILALSGQLGPEPVAAEGRVLAAFPVYRRGHEGRSDALTGFVFSEFHLNDIFAALPIPLKPGVRLEVRDGAWETAGHILFGAGPAAAAPERVAFRRTETTPVYGRIWSVDFVVQQGHGMGETTPVPRFVLLGGLLVTALATGLAASEVGRHRLARQRAQTMGAALESTSEALVQGAMERELAQQALQNSEERYRAVVDQAPVGILIVVAGRVAFTNRELLRILGVPGRETAVLGRRLEDLVAPADLPETQRRVARLLETSEASPPTVQVWGRPDGGSVVVEVAASASTFDEAPALQVVVRDLTEQDRAEREARLARARTQSIVNAAMDGIVLLDGEGRILMANPAAERIFRTAPGAAVGMSYGCFVPERLLQWYLQQLQLFRTGAIQQRVLGADEPAWARRLDGSEFPVEASVSALEIEGVRFSVVVLRDVSDRLQAEQERAELEGQLRQAQRLEAVGTLAGGIAHDFNNVLGAILGHVELATLDLPPSHPARDSLAQVSQAGLRARDLVRHILTFSRQHEHQRAPVVLSEIVTEALQLLRAGLPSSLVLAVDNRAGDARVVADASQIHQVVVNLCTNAAHAIGERPGRLTVTLDEVTFDPEGAAAHPDLHPGRYLRLGVHDTGAGMDREVLDRVFEPFFTTKAPGEGTGLGLAVVHGIVRAHEGAILAESVPGVGSRFQVFLPAAASEPAPEPAPAAAPAAGRGQRVIVVDDEPALASLLTRMLTRLGYRVQAFTEPAAALAAVQADPDGLDALLTDLTMPGFGGTELAARVRTFRPGLPILFSSGYLDRAAHPTGDLSPPHEFISKPVSLQVLGAALDRLLTDTARRSGGWKARA